MYKFILIFSLICSHLEAVAQFGPQRIITTELDGPESIAIGDIDGDTFPDIVIGTNYSNNKIAWSKNSDGYGNFGPLQEISIGGGQSRNITVADLDGDGDLDVIVPFTENDKLVWYKNLDGLGTFSLPQTIDAHADGVFHGVGADIDGDGDLDIVAAINQESSLVWYENLDGLGTFGSRNYLSTSLNTRIVSVADIDNDGDLDVVTNSSGNITIVWFENLDGLGTFGPQHIVAGAALFVAYVFCTDIDGDGDLDIMGATNAENKVAWHENLDGLGTFGPQQVVTIEAMNVAGVCCADFDNDGDIDVLYFSNILPLEDNSEVAWSENIDGLGTFGPKQVIDNTLNLIHSIFGADIDGDNDIDVFAVSFNSDEVVWYENQTIIGVEENQIDMLNVYPNPTKGVFFINSKNETIVNTTVYDILGKKVFQQEGNIQQLDISTLQSGMYFLKITTDGGSFVKKILKK